VGMLRVQAARKERRSEAYQPVRKGMNLLFSSVQSGNLYDVRMKYTNNKATATTKMNNITVVTPFSSFSSCAESDFFAIPTTSRRIHSIFDNNILNIRYFSREDIFSSIYNTVDAKHI